MLVVASTGSRPAIASQTSSEAARRRRRGARPTSAARTVLVPVRDPCAGAASVAAPVAAEERISDTVQAALACLAPHPSSLQAHNLVPALQAALGSMHQQPGSSRGWERVVLASPLLLGLLSLSTELLDQPAAAALGPEAPLLVLEVLSHMDADIASAAHAEADTPSADPACRQAQHLRALWRRAHAALGAAADMAGYWHLENRDVMTPEMLVRYYEAVGRAPFGCPASKSNGLGLLLRTQLKERLFSPSEGVRLLSAWAQLRRRMPFNPESYNFAELATDLACAAGQLSGEQLVAVAQAAPAFHWPVYRSIPLLHAVCREAVHRSLSGSLPLPVAQRVLSASAKGAAAMHPRLGHELEEASAEWVRSAPGLRNGSVPAPPALQGADLGPPQGGYVTPLWAHGAASGGRRRVRACGAAAV